MDFCGDDGETFVLIKDKKFLGQQSDWHLPKKDSALRNLLLLLLLLLLLKYKHSFI